MVEPAEAKGNTKVAVLKSSGEAARLRVGALRPRAGVAMPMALARARDRAKAQTQRANGDWAQTRARSGS